MSALRRRALPKLAEQVVRLRAVTDGADPVVRGVGGITLVDDGASGERRVGRTQAREHARHADLARLDIVVVVGKAAAAAAGACGRDLLVGWAERARVVQREARVFARAALGDRERVVAKRRRPRIEKEVV